MAGILDLLAGNQQPSLYQNLISGGQPQTGIGAFLQNAQSPGAMATSAPPPNIPMAPMPGMDAAAHVKKPGLFSQSGTGWKVLGILGDALQKAGGGQATYMDAIQRGQQDEGDQRRKLEQLRLTSALQSPDEWQYYLQNPDSRPVLDQMNAAKAIHFGVDPVSGAYGQFGAPTATSPSAPAAGAVVGGYRFLGGNPNDQRSWAPVGGSAAPPSTGFPGSR